MNVLQQEPITTSPRKMVTKKATQQNQNGNFGGYGGMGSLFDKESSNDSGDLLSRILQHERNGADVLKRSFGKSN